jgi:ankyrin repeat protein
MKHLRSIPLLIFLLIASVLIWRGYLSWPRRAELAIIDGDLSTLQKLVDDPNAYLAVTGRTRAPLLHIATRNSQTNLVEWLLRKGANPNLPDTEGVNVLDYAIRDLRFNDPHRSFLIKRLLKAGANPDAPDLRGDSTVTRTAMFDDLAALQLILPYSKRSNTTNKYGCTALHYAGNPELFQTLTNAGWDPTIKNLSGQTPMEMILQKRSNR